MAKQILFNSELRKQFLIGMNKVADPVRSTMGFAGRNVLISHNKMQAPETTKDGVKSARSISLKDPIENAAAWMTKMVAEKTLELAGDSTTCSILLFQQIVTQAFWYIGQGVNSVELKKGIEKASARIVKELKIQSIPVNSNDMIRQIATVASNNDEEIGSLIAGAFKKIGNDGIILIEEGKSIKTEIRIDDGYQMERGWTSPFWVTNKEKMICELVEPFILIVDGKIERFAALKGVLEGMMQAKKRDILIIADSVEGEAFDTLLVNKIRGLLNVVIINSPSYGERRKQMLEDIAILSGGQFISEDFGTSLEEATLSFCGTCEKIIVTKDLTTIVNGDGQKEKMVSRSAQINSLIDQSVSDVEIEMLKQRLAKLNGGIAVFSVGGVTETEMKEKKDRVDDAIRATKCAIEEGIVSGGGIALLRCINKLNLIYTENKYQKIGISIMQAVLEAPLRQMLINAGIEDEKKWYQFSKDNKTCDSIIKELLGMGSGFGYNVKKEKIENLIENGIIDPTKVIRTALENAVSMACMVIISECLVVEVDS